MRIAFLSFLSFAFLPSLVAGAGSLRRTNENGLLTEQEPISTGEDEQADFFTAMEAFKSDPQDNEEQDNEERVLGRCYNNYYCPAHSYRKPNRKCYDSFDDCACYSGYYKQGHRCVKYHGGGGGGGHCYNNYRCPAYSSRKPNRHCYDNFDDCYCWSGYYKYGNKCVRKHSGGDSGGHCSNNYRCPAYSSRKSNRRCYDTFDDCYCWSGYYKHGNKCVRKHYYGYMGEEEEDGSSPDTLGPPGGEEAGEEAGEDGDSYYEDYYDEAKDEIEKEEEGEEAFEEELIGGLAP